MEDLTKKKTRRKRCCALIIKMKWDMAGSPMNIVHYEGKCPKCGHYIGLTQTSEIEN